MNAQYWQSYSRYNTYISRFRRSTHCVGIFLTLDSDARFDFSAIRLLILCEQSESNIFGSLPTEGFVPTEIHANQIPARNKPAYHPHRSSVYATSNPPPVNDQNIPARTCTVALKVVFHGRADVVIVPMAAKNLGLGPSELRRWRVLYDSTRLSSPSKPSIFVFLDTNRLSIMGYGSFKIPIYNIRILPIPSQRSERCKDLPRDIIRYIVEAAIEDELEEWQEELWNYSSVCKAWEHVIELLFEYLNKDPGEVDLLTDVRKFGRLLRRRPHYRDLIRDLDCSNFLLSRWRFSTEYGRLRWYDFLEIMQYARLTTSIVIPTMPLELIDKIINHLQNMRQVRKFEIERNRGEEPQMDMEDIQMAISRWKNLERLKVNSWGYARAREPEYVLPERLESSLRILMLSTGDLSDSRVPPTLSGTQLLRFISPTGCNIVEIWFSGIKGPSNTDFRMFLTAAAQTLVTIHLYGCDFQRDQDDEELAFDMVMPEMRMLEFLDTEGNISTLSLVRKPQKLNDDDTISMFIAHDFDEQYLPAAMIEKAMRVTEWDCVNIVIKDLKKQWNTEIFERVGEIAEKRGRNFELSVIDDDVTYSYGSARH